MKTKFDVTNNYSYISSQKFPYLASVLYHNIDIQGAENHFARKFEWMTIYNE